MKIVVTGGAGYVGSVVTAHLLQAGHEVIVLDKLLQNDAQAVPAGARLVQADIADFAKVITPQDNVDAVMHFASFIAAGESMQKPDIYWQNNVVASLGLLEGVRQLGIKKFIFSSTAAVYGNPQTVPITEDAAKQPTNTYGMTKLALDMAITSYAAAYGLAATSLRYFNVAGADGAQGERHIPETHIIPLALAVAAGDTEQFKLFGDDYPTPDGTCIRDYIHVSDLADAHLLALDHIIPGKHAIYNLGNGNGFSNKEIIAAIERVTGRKLNVQLYPRREGDPSILVASSELARKELGWQPQKTSIDEIIQDAWDFYCSLNSLDSGPKNPDSKESSK